MTSLPAILRTVPFVALVVLPTCDLPRAWGEATSIIVGVTDELWAEVEESVYAAMEPRIFTVRDERTFNVTQQDPRRPDWDNLRMFVQVLLLGRQGDAWIDEALARREHAGTLTPPQILQVHNVWARGQLVTILLLPEEGGASEVEAHLGSLGELLLRQYREYVQSRMFVTGKDSVLADSLAQVAGFYLMVPQVYEAQRRDEVYVFRNDNPDPSELIRQVSVTWRSPLPEGYGSDELLEWRAALVSSTYSFDQIAVLDEISVEPLEVPGGAGLQIRAIWENPPDLGWPAAGPFVLRSIPCPSQNRLYLLDAWLYAPGRSKYEYMLQLEIILDSFRCT